MSAATDLDAVATLQLTFRSAKHATGGQACARTWLTSPAKPFQHRTAQAVILLPKNVDRKKPVVQLPLSLMKESGTSDAPKRVFRVIR